MDPRRRETFSEANRDNERYQDKVERRRQRLKRMRRNAAKPAFQQVNWEAYQHAEMYDMIMKARPGRMGQQARDWNKLGEEIEATTRQVEESIERVLQTWRGSAAVGAANSNTKLTQWAGEMSTRAEQIGAGLVRYAEAVEWAQAKMPPPQFAHAEARWRDGYDVVASDGPSGAILLSQLLDDQKPDFDKAQSAKAEAVRVMQNYSNQSHEVHDTIPTFYDAPQGPPNSPPPQQPPLGGGGGGPGPGGPGGSPGGTPGGGPGSGLPGSGVAGDVDGDGISDTTTPDSFTGQTGGGANPPGHGPTGFGGPGGFGPGAGGADATRGGPGFGAGAGGAGGGIAGAAPLAARGGAGMAGGLGGAGGLAGARRAGGVGGGFFPPLGAAGAQREEDGEHKNKYDDGLDLFDDLPPAYPPVFGA